MLGLLGNDELLDEDIVNFDTRRRTSNHPFLGLDGNLKPLLQNLVQIVDSYHLPNTRYCQLQQRSLQIPTKDVVCNDWVGDSIGQTGIYIDLYIVLGDRGVTTHRQSCYPQVDLSYLVSAGVY